MYSAVPYPLLLEIQHHHKQQTLSHEVELLLRYCCVTQPMAQYFILFRPINSTYIHTFTCLPLYFPKQPTFRKCKRKSRSCSTSKRCIVCLTFSNVHKFESRGLQKWFIFYLKVQVFRKRFIVLCFCMDEKSYQDVI